MKRKRVSKKTTAAEDILSMLRGKLRIDKDNLDAALVEQPELFFHVAEEMALSNSRRDQLRDNLKVVTAEAAADLRREMEDNGEKITEAKLAAEVELTDSLKQARGEYREAERQAELLSALKEAFMQRSYMLKDLASLYVTQYHSQSAVRGPDATGVQDRAYMDRRRWIDDARRSKAGRS